MTDSWMSEFERRLQQLEATVELPDIDLTTVADSASRAIGCLWKTARIDFWVIDEHTCHRLDSNAFIPQTGDVTSRLRQLPIQTSTWVASDQYPAQTIDTPVAEGRVLVRRHNLADAYQLVVTCTGEERLCSQAHAEEATSAAAALLASRVTQHLLAAASRTATRQSNLLAFASRLQACQTRADVHQSIANEQAAYLPNCRISSLDVNEHRHQLKAVTGAGQVNPQAAQVKLVESLMDQLLLIIPKTSSQPPHANVWISTETLQEQIECGELNHDVSELIEDFRTTGVHQVLAVPVLHKDHHAISVLVESYDKSQRTEPLPSDWHDLIHSTTTRCLLAERSGKSTIKFSTRTIITTALFLSAISFLIPMDFELPVPGQLVASGRRSLFAPESGTVTTVHFTNEQLVVAGAPLVSLSNPELSLRLSELNGEIATTEAAVAAANARRINRTADGSAAEGQILKQSLKSLKSERLLTQQRIDSLEIKAPFTGIVVRQDAELNLTNRPLQRGQRIAELIPKTPTWELELHIPQSHYAYLASAQREEDSALEIRYVISSEPDTTYKSTVHSIEQFTYSRNNVLVQNARANILLPQSSNVRSGTSVSARISCGTRSVGFVAARRLIELFQHLKFVWWG